VSSGGQASVRPLERPLDVQGMKPSLGHEDRTLRWKRGAFWKGCWKGKTFGARSNRSDATRAPQGAKG
jgi:hypothetical protein